MSCGTKEIFHKPLYPYAAYIARIYREFEDVNWVAMVWGLEIDNSQIFEFRLVRASDA